MIDYTPPPTIKKFMLSKAFVRAIIGPFGSAKSTACVIALLKHAVEQEPDVNGIRPTRFALVRNTARMLADTTQKTVFEWVPPGQAGNFRKTVSIYDIAFPLPDGTRVETEWMFRALDGPEDIRNLLSLEVTGAWCNEYRELSPDVIVSLLGRLGRFPAKKRVHPTWYGLIMDSNPPDTSSYWYSFFEEGVSEQVRQMLEVITEGTGAPLAELFKQPSGLSPEAENIENLPKNYYQTLMAMNQDKSEEWVKVHVHGQYGYLKDGLAVYPRFTPGAHLAKESIRPLSDKPITIGLDFGLTPAAVFLQQDANDRWLVLGELISESAIGCERFMEKLTAHLIKTFPLTKEYDVWGDPAGMQRVQTDEKTCFQIVRSFGFVIRPGAALIETRLGSVRRVLARLDGMLIDPSALMLIRGFHGEYKYKRVRGAHGMYDDKPQKNAVSHVHDALNHTLGVFEGPAMEGRRPRRWGHAASVKTTKRRDFNVY